jgi:hypothetical protein
MLFAIRSSPAGLGAVNLAGTVRNFSGYLLLGRKDRTGAPWWGGPLPFFPVRSTFPEIAPLRRGLKKVCTDQSAKTLARLS